MKGSQSPPNYLMETKLANCHHQLHPLKRPAFRAFWTFSLLVNLRLLFATSPSLVSPSLVSPSLASPSLPSPSLASSLASPSLASSLASVSSWEPWQTSKLGQQWQSTIMALRSLNGNIMTYVGCVEIKRFLCHLDISTHFTCFFHHFAQKWVPTRGFQSEAQKKRPKIFGTLGWSMASASSVSFSNFCSTALTWPRKKQPPSIVLVDLIGI